MSMSGFGLNELGAELESIKGKVQNFNVRIQQMSQMIDDSIMRLIAGDLRMLRKRTWLVEGIEPIILSYVCQEK